MSASLIWERDGRDWPNREASRFIMAGGLCWHVQQMGCGPTLLLVHGTGAATHSWRTLMPLLAPRFNIVAPDLPGHGFTETPSPERLSLPGMSSSLSMLLQTLDVRPELVLGHSAGAAILARMILDEQIAPRMLISINGALLPLHGLPGHIFSPAAKLLASISLVPRLFAWRATDHAAVERLINSTGSTLDQLGVALYARLLSNPGHVAGALGMMANWDLRPLARELPFLNTALTLVVGDADKTISPAEAERVKTLVPAASIIHLPGLGHLAHEEQPQKIAELVTELARSVNLMIHV